MEAGIAAIGCFALALVCLAHEQKKLLREIADKLDAAVELRAEPDGRDGEPPEVGQP